MENKSSKNLRREKVTRYSIRKYSFGAASVAVAALFMFLGNGAVSANELSKTEGQGHEKSLENNESQVANESSKPAYLAPAAPVVENTVKPTEGAPVEKAAAEEPTAKPAEATTPALDKTQLKNYISEIESKISAGKYATKTEESVALLTSELASAKSVLESATSQEELNLAYRNLVTTVSSKLKNKPKKEAPKVDTTNGQPTVGKKAENTEPKAGTNSIENSGSHDSRNGKVMDKENAFRTEATAATHQPTTTTVGNISYTLEYSNDADKEIYLYNEEEANINITINSTDGAISKAFVKAAGNVYLDPDKKARKLPPGNETQEEVDGFGWTYHQILSDTPSPATVRITGKPNDTFMGLKPTTRKEDQNSVLGARYLQVQDAAGGAIAAGGNKNAPGYFNLVVKSQTYKYDIKDLTDSTRITVNDINNVTDAELTTIKSRLQLEHSKTSNDARFVGGADVANPTSVIDTVAVSTTEPSKLVVTYKDGSTDTIEKNKVLNVRPKGIIPFSNPTAKEIYVYKGEETNLEFGVTDDSGKIKDLRIVQGSANINNSGAARGQVKNEYGLTMTSETNENGIAATTDHPAITRITGTVSVSGKPNFVGPLMTRYLVAEDLEGAVFSYPDANKNMDQEGAFKLVVREQTQKYDVQLQGAESNKIAVADVNNLSAEDFEKIKSNIKIVYNTADDARLKDKDETRHGSLVKNASQYIQSITNSGNNIVVTYKDGSTDTIEKTAVLRSAPGPVVTRTQSRKSVLSEDGVLSTDRTLTGTGTPGATIKVSVKDEQDPTQLTTLYDNVTVGTDGNWSVDLTHGLYSNITKQDQLYPRKPLSVTQTVNGLESVETKVPVTLGVSEVLPSEASADKASVVAGTKKLVVKVPHYAGIAYIEYNKEGSSRKEIGIKRETATSDWAVKDESLATIDSVTTDGFQDTITLTMKEKIKENLNVSIISNIKEGKYSSVTGWRPTPVTNQAPTLASTNGQTETTVNVGDTVNPVDLVTAADHEDDKNATLGTKGTPEVVSVNGDEAVKTIDTTTAGTYVVKYKVVDSQGKESDVLTHTVIVNLDKQPAINAVEQAATAQIEKINGNTAATKEEKDAAIAKVNNDKKAALDAINADTVKTQTALTQAQNAGTTAISNDNPETSIKTNAKNAIDQDLASKISAIEGRQDLSEAEKTEAKNKATEKATAAKTAIENAATTAEVNTAKGDGTTAINNVTPVAKEAAKKAINDELTAKNTEIEGRQDLSQAEKTAAKAEAKKLADAQLAEIAKQPDATDTPEAATTAQQAVDAAKTKGVADVRAVNPLAKDAAKADIETARQNKVNGITNNSNLSQAEKDAAIAKVNKAAEDATKAVDAATTADALTTAKGNGTTAINNVTPVAKEAAKQAIADALNGKDGQKGKLQEIEERTDLTDEEKAAAKKDAQDKADAELAKINAQPDAADTPTEATTAQEAVDAAGTKGAADVKSVNPTAVKKPEAKKAIEDALTAKNNAIDARDDLTPEQKTALKNAAKAKADAAKDAIDKATTDADVNQAKTDGETAVANVTPVAKEPAKKAIAKALEDKNAEIDKRTDLTDEEKAEAKKEAKAKADAQLAEIAKQPDVAETLEAAQTAQTAVDTAKKTGVDEVTAVNPTAVTKPEAKKAIEDKLAEQLETIANTPDATDEEKAEAAKKATDAAEAAKAEVDKATTDAAVKAEKDKAVGEGDTKGTIDQAVPVVEDKPNARKAIDEEAKAKKAEIDARTDFSPKAKEVLKAKVDKAAERAKEAIDAVSSVEDVNTIEEADKTAIRSIGDINRPIDKVLVKDPSALTDEAKAKILEEVKKVNPTAKEVKYNEDGNIEVTTENGDKGIIIPTKLVKTEGELDNGKGGNDINKPLDRVIVKNPANLTDEEKAKIVAEVEEVNPDAIVTIDENGTVSVSTQAGKTSAIPATDLVRTKEDASNPDAGNSKIVKPADKVVGNPTNPDDRATVEEKLRELNPEAKSVIFDENGNATVTLKDGTTATIPEVDLFKSEAYLTEPNAGNDIVKPADKTVVSNPDALTPEEKKAIEDKVKAVNPEGTAVVVDDKGNATVTTPEGKTAVIPASDLTKSAEEAAKPNAGNDIVKPADKTVVSNPNALTPEEKKAIEEKVKAVNPEATVAVDDKGNATVTLENGKTAVIPAADLTKSATDAAKPNAGNDIVKPADKTVVSNPDALTPEEKKAIEEKVKAVNPGATVAVDDKGNATVTVNGKTAVIPAADLTKSAEEAAKPNAGNDIVKPADKTVVANPNALTPEEKKAIEEKVKAVNPEATVAVDDKGNATVTLENGKTAVIPAADLTKSATDAAKPNAGNDIVKPADKTVVSNPDALTPEEKKAIEEKVKAVNPGATVAVDDKGNATVTKDGKTAVIPAADLTKSEAQAKEPNAGNDIVKPADKTVVANPDSLTQDEKDAIVAKVKAVNPGAEVVVDDKGNATVTVNGKTAVIPAADLTKSAEEAAKPNAGNDIVKPADKTVVANPDSLTQDEKDAIVAKVKAVNPGAEVVVDDKGNATVTVNGKTAVIPATDLTKSAEDAAKPNAGNDIVKPADKTVVANPDSLTQDEKDAIVAKVKAVNPGAEVVVDDKGNATVTVNGKTAVIPATDLTKSEAQAKEPNAGNDIVKPADKTVVANPDSLTQDEKDAIVAKVKAVNPGAEVVVDDKGNATVTVNGKIAVIPAADLTKNADAEKAPNAGNDIVKPASKKKVANPDSLTPEEKKAIADKVSAVNPGSTVVVDDKGNATVTTKDGKTAVIPASDLTKSEKDVNDGKAKNNAVTPASKTKVANPEKLTDAEKKAIADKVKAANPGAEVVVDDKGNATVVKDGNVSVIPSTDLVKVQDDAKKDNGGNDANTPAAKTVVENPDSLDPKEKEEIADKVKSVNPGAEVSVDDKGNATVTKADGTVLNIPSTDLVIPAANLADQATNAKVKTPAIRTLVENKAKLTDAEQAAVKKTIEAVNPGSTVVVDDKGNATVTLPDGSTATISKEQLVKDKEAVSKSKHGGDNLDIDLSKVEVADLANITPEEREKFQFMILGAITDVEEFDLDAFLKTTDDKGNTVYTSKKDPNVKITIDKDGNATVEKDGKKEAAVNIDKAGNVTIVTKEGQVLAIPRDDAFKQRPYVPSNGGGNNSGNGNGTSGNNATNNTDAKVNKAKLEGAIHQLDELIIKESAKLDAETAKEANDLLADAKKVFANADATQAEVDAMVKRIEDFMAKVAPSTDHATPANDQAAQKPAVAPATTQAAANASQEAATNARKAAKELPNTGTADSTVAMVAAAASALLGLGLAGRRRKEDEEA